MGPNVVDEIDCGSFFDHIDDLIEFPPENECGNGLVGPGDCKDFPTIWDEALPDTDNLFSGHNNSSSDLSAELSVPYEDIVQLEWLSNFVEDSFSDGGLTLGKDNLSSMNKENKVTPLYQFPTSSPVSVLESSSSTTTSSSSSSSSGEKPTPLTANQRGPQRARSKRPRPATFNPRPAMQQLISPTSSFSGTPYTVVATGIPSESENFAESEPAMKYPKLETEEQKKKKKIKSAVPFSPNTANQNSAPQAVRKCLHCEITKTPQWRAGPMGPKTLCNACGVRYKSGRLFPEYRPAASPTFVPSIHSNSHKKVIEMRNKIVGEEATPGIQLGSDREFISDDKPALEYNI